MLHLIPTLLLSAGCVGGDDPVDTIEADEIVLRLVNPTSVDPFIAVSSFRLEVEVDGQVVASEEFGRTESPTLSGLSDYGTVRFRLAGLSGSTVLSYGRSPEVALYPGVDRSVPILFLPINRVIPITTDELSVERSAHFTTRTLDGHILIAGGRTPNSHAAYADLEIYDPALSEFTPLGDSLPQGTVYPTGAWTEDYSQLFFAGGGTLGAGGALTGVVETASLDAATLQIDEVDDMNVPRVKPCFTIFRDTTGIAIGGNEDDSRVDYLKADLNTGIFIWDEINLQGLDPTQVTGCALADTGQVYLQGLSTNSTGVFDFTEQARLQNPDIEDAFEAVEDSDFQPLDGAMLIPVGDGAIWVGGGLVRDDGGGSTPNERGDLFLVDSQTYVSGADPASPRVYGSWDHWIQPGWAVLGCGSSDGQPLNVQIDVELLHLASGDRFPDIDLDRLRPECRLNTLPDGSVLFTGGYSATLAGEPTAALLVPYLEGI